MSDLLAEANQAYEDYIANLVLELCGKIPGKQELYKSLLNPIRHAGQTVFLLGEYNLSDSLLVEVSRRLDHQVSLLNEKETLKWHFTTRTTIVAHAVLPTKNVKFYVYWEPTIEHKNLQSHLDLKSANFC